MAGSLGALLTGVFATKVVNPDAADGSTRLLLVQAVGVVATWVWSGGVSFVLLKLVSLATPLRAEEQDEWTGMDASESGERGYITTDLESAAERNGHAAA